MQLFTKYLDPFLKSANDRRSATSVIDKTQDTNASLSAQDLKVKECIDEILGKHNLKYKSQWLAILQPTYEKLKWGINYESMARYVDRLYPDRITKKPSAENLGKKAQNHPYSKPTDEWIFNTNKKGQKMTKQDEEMTRIVNDMRALLDKMPN